MKPFLALSSAAMLCATLGCGPQVKPQPQPTIEAEPAQLDKIKEALKKIGITKEIVTVKDVDDDWLVTFKPDGTGPSGEAPGRPIPEKALVNKTTFEAKKLETGGPGGRGEGRGPGGGTQRELDPMKDKDKK